jgi:dTDP-4-dehydrorhamnose 3,5-epimerase
MDIIATKIPDVLILEPRLFEDDRGLFYESFNQQRFFEQVGIAAKFVQDNHSRSRRSVLRGLHYQIQQPQGKLVRVVAGEVFDVAVDLRRDSVTFGQWVGTYLNAVNHHQIWIPAGFAHGFLVLSEWAECLYKTTDYYCPGAERTVAWNDPDLAIDWPIDNLSPILSPKDQLGTRFQEAEVFECARFS